MADGNTTSTLTNTILSAAKSWSVEHDKLRGVPDGPAKQPLYQAERAARQTLWDAVGRDEPLFARALESVGKRPVQKVQLPKVPSANSKSSGKEPYYPKGPWEPAIGDAVRVKLFEPSTFILGTIVGREKLGRYFVWTSEYGRKMIGKSRLYRVYKNGEPQITALDTLPPEALVPLAYEQAYIPSAGA